MILRKAAAGDIAAILQIEDRSSWKTEDYLAYDCTVAEIEGRVVGVLLARQIADAEFEILNVAVAREFRRRGVADSLIRAQIAERNGDWFLEVRVSNAPARNLYHKIGFSETGTREAYYRDPPEAAVVMGIRSC